MKPVIALLLLALTAACGGEGPPETPAPAPDLVWPAPPETPRVKFLYAFGGARDLGFTGSAFERMVEFFAGEADRSLAKPYALAVGDGLAAVADTGARALHLFGLAGESYARIDEIGGKALLSPVGVALGDGRIYVSDSVLGRVFVLDRAGALVTSIDTIERPTGLAVDPATGRLYVADTLDHRIAVFEADGTPRFAFGGRGTAETEFNYPTHLAVRDGRLYVNDTMNFRLQTFDLDGAFVSSFGTHGDGSGHFAQPKGVAVDGAGHVYVVDALFNRVQVFDERGRFLLAFGGQGANPGEMWLPAGVYIDGDRIYLADAYNRRIQVFRMMGGG